MKQAFAIFCVFKTLLIQSCGYRSSTLDSHIEHICDNYYRVGNFPRLCIENYAQKPRFLFIMAEIEVKMNYLHEFGILTIQILVI